jgi:alpha-beta hydrolase superfamily lysophospholipase
MDLSDLIKNETKHWPKDGEQIALNSFKAGRATEQVVVGTNGDLEHPRYYVLLLYFDASQSGSGWCVYGKDEGITFTELVSRLVNLN